VPNAWVLNTFWMRRIAMPLMFELHILKIHNDIPRVYQWLMCVTGNCYSVVGLEVLIVVVI
jgi:hypothetical protein